MDQALAKKAGELGGIRDFVKEDIFISKNDNDPLTRMIKADAEATACAPIHHLKDAKYRVIGNACRVPFCKQQSIRRYFIRRSRPRPPVGRTYSECKQSGRV